MTRTRRRANPRLPIGQINLTAIKSRGADAFVRRPPPDIRLFLVHGSDEGAVRERAAALLRAGVVGVDDPTAITVLDGDALAADPGRLSDEAYAIGMFAEKRALRIAAGARDLLPQFKPLFERPPQDCVVVVEAGLLRKGHALRTAFEEDPRAAAVECLADDRETLSALVDAEMRAAGVALSPDAHKTLIDLLGADRMTTRGELAKLALYAHGKKTIDVADVEAIVADAAPSTLDALVDFAFFGDFAGLEAAADRYFVDGGDAGELARRVVVRLTLLHRLKSEMEAGRPFDAALMAAQPRLPFFLRAPLIKQAERWSAGALARRLPGALSSAARVRAEPRLAQATVVRMLWAVASGAGKR